MSDPRAHLRDLARWARLAHVLIVVRLLAVSAVGAVGPDVVPQAFALGASLGLALVIIAVLIVAARAALRAGLAQAAMRVWGVIVVWATLVLVAQLAARDDARTFVSPASLVTDLGWMAWCSLLGRAVRSVGAADASWLRATAMGWLVLNIGVQLAPLPMLSALGMMPLMVVSMAAAVVPFGAAAVDAQRLLRATAAARHDVPALADPDAHGDAPWRPGQ